MPFNANQHRDNEREHATTIAKQFAFLIAMIVTFFGTPDFYRMTISHVVTFTESRYGPDFVDFALLGWWPVSGLLVFYVAQLTVRTALVSLFLVAVLRFV